MTERTIRSLQREVQSLQRENIALSDQLLRQQAEQQQQQPEQPDRPPNMDEIVTVEVFRTVHEYRTPHQGPRNKKIIRRDSIVVHIRRRDPISTILRACEARYNDIASPGAVLDDIQVCGFHHGTDFDTTLVNDLPAGLDSDFRMHVIIVVTL